MLSEMAHWYTVGVDGRSGGAPRGLVWTRPQCRAGWRTVGLAPLRSYISNFELHLRGAVESFADTKSVARSGRSTS